MVKIFFTRHGETEWNVQRRMQGWLDSPLTDQGKQQAVALGERLTDISLASVYSSTAPRAIATTELICGDRDIPIIPEERLREVGLGEWEGCSVDELFEKENENCQNFFYHPDKYIPPKDAESFGEVQQRIAVVLGELVKKHDNEGILVVTHGIFMRNVSSYLRQKPIEEIWSEQYKPTALSLVVAENGIFEIKYWNDTGHYNE